MIWEQFFDWLMGHESRTITNDPRDPGGQTCWGISRRYHPAWVGWRMVDTGTTSGPELALAVSTYYRETYGSLWASVPERAREVAVDTAVNMGHVYAVQCMQDAMNRLAASTYVDVDGQIGPQTKAALKTVDPSALAYCMCAIRMAEYNRRARRDKSKQVWLAGWLNRVSDLMGVI